MKTMNDYTLYCTPEQTKRAYKLGAPIRTFECDNKIARESFIKRFDAIELEGIVMGDIPTTQQMLNWLREKGFNAMVDFKNEDEEPYEYTYRYLVYYKNHNFYGDECKSYRQAELAAIDAALDYLEKGE